MPASDPASNTQTFVALAPVSLGNAVDADLTTRVDMSQFEYVEVIGVMGVGDTVTVITAQEVATASGGTPVDIAGKVITLGALEDGTAEQMQIRCRGRERYLNLRLQTGTGTSSLACIVLKAYGRKYTDGLAAYSSAVTALGFS